MKTLYICTLFITISVLSAGCGSSGLNNEDCGDHGENIGGQCVCDPGYNDQNGKCIADGVGDGDISEIDNDTDGDIDKTDKPVDGDVELVDITPDGDSPDADPDMDDNCNCPVFEGTFCIDPEISNPDDYKRVIVQPGAKPGCTMTINITDVSSNAFSGEVSCDSNGRAKIESLGCELDYDVSENSVKLLCDTQQYNFHADFCLVEDGDEELDDVDLDDVDLDDVEPEDIEEPENDGDEPDREEIEEEEIEEVEIEEEVEVWPGCETNEECGDYRYCDVIPWPWECTDGVCNQATPCPHGFTCVIESGLCDPVIAEGDEDTDYEIICTPANQDTFCGYGYYCNDLDRCDSDCSQTYPACPEDEECNFDIGRCERTGANNCELDSDCVAELGQWHYCNLGGFCQSDCSDVVACVGYGMVCDSGRCVVDDTDGDEEDTICTDDSICPMGEYCMEDDFADWKCMSDCTLTQECIDLHESNWICTERGRCVQSDDECNTDQDCADLGKISYYCNGTYCDSNCLQDSDCENDTSVCPPACTCSEFGRCAYDGGDIDVDTGVYCTSDPECYAFNEICNLETNECYKECEIDEDCIEFSNGLCDVSIGECYYLNNDDDFENYEYAEIIECTDDNACPLPREQWFCQISTGYCVDKCSLCVAGWACDQTTYECIDPCAGDADCDNPGGDPEITELNQICEGSFECPDYYYCSDAGWCETECLPSCPTGYECDFVTKRCAISGSDGPDVPENNGCLSNDDCMHLEKHYCDVSQTWTCISDCIDDIDCPGGYVCAPRGQCEANLASCVSDASCPAGTYCDDTRWKCYAYCFDNSSCPENMVCDDRGRCSVADYEQSDEFATCTGDDAECPSFSYCDINICRADCLPPNFGCSQEMVCAINGRCETPATDTDQVEVDVDPDPEIEQDASGNLECLSDIECIYGSHCTSDGVTPGTCQTSCLADFHCGPGLYCDCHGYCSSNPDPGLNCDGFMTCTIDADCEGAGYCWNNMCRADCLVLPELGFNFGCPDGQFCNDLLSCEAYDGDIDQVDIEIPTAIPCTVENQCPYHTYCDGNQGQCMAVCMNDSHCPEGTFCNNRGQCDTSASDWDEGTGYLPCSTIDDCPVHAYCFDATYCKIDCVPFLNLDCENSYSCYRGQCVAP